MTSKEKLAEAEALIKEVRTILKEEDRALVNTARLLERLQKALNYKES